MYLHATAQHCKPYDGHNDHEQGTQNRARSDVYTWASPLLCGRQLLWALVASFGVYRVRFGCRLAHNKPIFPVNRVAVGRGDSPLHRV